MVYVNWCFGKCTDFDIGDFFVCVLSLFVMTMKGDFLQMSFKLSNRDGRRWNGNSLGLLVAQGSEPWLDLGGYISFQPFGELLGLRGLLLSLILPTRGMAVRKVTEEQFLYCVQSYGRSSADDGDEAMDF
ncbi:hypothetical protein Salat_0039400 [Sesamum alatum]|uniref:Uncharacterized protein n=1 Tax=Sesamum alatum TaxID=300844 RepID=A0AAE1YUL2_9LAMI|nr:hypothetical protein Salat_0039400 [Sesamum alatum]